MNYEDIQCSSYSGGGVSGRSSTSVSELALASTSPCACTGHSARKNDQAVMKMKARSCRKLIRKGKSRVQHDRDARRRIAYKSEAEDLHEIDVFILSLDTEVLRIRFPSHSMCIRISDFLCLREGALLNDTIIDFYLNHIVSHLLPDDSSLKLHLFPSLFWCRVKTVRSCESRSTDANEKCLSKTLEELSQVEYWLEEEDVFNVDFLVLPVIHNQHWSLAIVCSPLFSIKSNTEVTDANSSHSPVVVIFDSQQSVDCSSASHVLSTIKDFLELAFTSKTAFNDETVFLRDSFKCVIPKNLPQQQNNVDCGIYVLEYAKRFILSPPPMSYLQTDEFDFSVFYPDFDVSSKRREVQRTILSLCSDYDTWSSLLDTVDVPFEYKNHVVRLHGDK